MPENERFFCTWVGSSKGGQKTFVYCIQILYSTTNAFTCILIEQYSVACLHKYSFPLHTSVKFHDYTCKHWIAQCIFLQISWIFFSLRFLFKTGMGVWVCVLKSFCLIMTLQIGMIKKDRQTVNDFKHRLPELHNSQQNDYQTKQTKFTFPLLVYEINIVRWQ